MTNESKAVALDRPVVLFDGVCNLCNGAVNFLIDRDPEARFLLASLQAEAAQRLLEDVGMDANYLDSIVLVEGDQVYVQSDAVLEIARRMPGAWKLLYGFKIIPRVLRDVVYDFIARRRYAWFGQRDICRLPTPELKARFLE